MTTTSDRLSAALQERVRAAIDGAGGFLPFDRFMAMALYEPGLGYYARDDRQFGTMPDSGSDFVTAPELSPLFGEALAAAVADALDATGSDTVTEFGAGRGALAEPLLRTLGPRVRRYRIVELSAALSARQRERLAPFAPRVEWLTEWPARIDGAIIGNEVLDAMPVQLLHLGPAGWQERGVAHDGGDFVWADRATRLRPPGEPAFATGAVTELHTHATAFVRTLAAHMGRAVATFIDYGFPEHEYYHPQRHGGTLMCHRGHRADPHPIVDIGCKDITAHLDFSALALAAQDAGLDVVGYTSQARFLIDCGLPGRMAAADLVRRASAARLLTEHEMGELFKVITFARGANFGPDGPVGFRQGDRTHTL